MIYVIYPVGMLEDVVRRKVKVCRVQANGPDQQAIGSEAGVAILEFVPGPENAQDQIVSRRKLDGLRHVLIVSSQHDEVGLRLLDEVSNVQELKWRYKYTHMVEPKNS